METQNIKPKIAIAGIAIECSTFSPAVTHLDAFHINRAEELMSIYPFLSENSSFRKQANWFPTMKARALPGGIVSRATYDILVSEILDKLKQNLPYHGLFLDIHGAMSVEGLDDPEGDFILKIRAIIGNETMISSCMDLHGNVTKTLAENTDLITCFRMAPHEDAMESRERAVFNLLERLESGKGKPKYKAWIPVPILLPGEMTSTRIEPGKSLYAMVKPAAAQEGIIDVGIWIGYAWADAPRNHALVMAIGDDKEKVAKAAEKIAAYFWEVREKFEFVAPTASLAFCLEKAFQAEKKPFFISDMGDNPTAGGAGDVTWTLSKILARPEFKNEHAPSLIYASIPDPNFVAEAIKLGKGKKINAAAGALVDNRFSAPVVLNGTIENIVYGDVHAEVEVVVKVGSVHVIVTKKRKPYHLEADFTRLNLKPRAADILVVKIGYLEPELFDMQKDWIMAQTPGGVDQDLIRLNHQRIKRPMFPIDTDINNPDLTAQFV